MSFFSKIMDTKVEVTRKRGEYRNGLYVDLDKETFEVSASVQPLTGDEVLQVPEGDRGRRHVNLWTQDEIKEDDEVSWKGLDFEVQAVECWDFTKNCDLSHYKSRAVQIDA